MKLELRINGENKLFTTDFISGRMYRKLLEYDEVMNYNNLSVDDMDKLVSLTCEVYNNQFTLDDFYDGISVDNLIPTIRRIIIFIRTGRTPEELAKEATKGNVKGEQ